MTAVTLTLPDPPPGLEVSQLVVRTLGRHRTFYPCDLSDAVAHFMRTTRYETDSIYAISVQRLSPKVLLKSYLDVRAGKWTEWH